MPKSTAKAGELISIARENFCLCQVTRNKSCSFLVIPTATLWLRKIAPAKGRPKGFAAEPVELFVSLRESISNFRLES